MADTETPRTAADVLREHQQIGMHGVHIVCRCRARVLFMHQHQEDMLRAAGLLATAEHDREVAAQALRGAATSWLTETPPGGGLDTWGRGWLACRDAVVHDISTTRPDRIAAGEEP